MDIPILDNLEGRPLPVVRDQLRELRANAGNPDHYGFNGAEVLRTAWNALRSLSLSELRAERDRLEQKWTGAKRGPLFYRIAAVRGLIEWNLKNADPPRWGAQGFNPDPPADKYERRLRAAVEVMDAADGVVSICETAAETLDCSESAVRKQLKSKFQAHQKWDNNDRMDANTFRSLLRKEAERLNIKVEEVEKVETGRHD